MKNFVRKLNHRLNRIVWYLNNKPLVIISFDWCKFAPIIPDKLFIKVHFRLCVGYKLNLDNPKSYNEKLQWLKFYDKHDEYTALVDKVEVKKYVASIVGEDHVIKTIGVWNNVEEINWASLPKQFVVKSTNDSGGVVVCKDKQTFNIEEAKDKLKYLGGRDYTLISKEYPYKNVPHRFLAEEYLEDESGFELKDYKFFCFNGEPKFLFVATGRQQNDTRFDFYDTEFHHLPIINGHPNADTYPLKPKNFDKMLLIAEKLSKGIPHVRVDLYNVNGTIYFGELTFFHWSGMVPFEPSKWDYIFGDYLKLPVI